MNPNPKPATAQLGNDEDLSGGPVLWLWAPDPSADRPWRRFQHWYQPAAFSLLHVVWRFDSAVVVAKRRLWGQAAALVAHYAFFLALVPASTLLAAVLFGGCVMAYIVTSSHTAEDLVESHQHDWVRNQFDTTCDAQPGNPLSDWLWGGMQHQLARAPPRPAAAAAPLRRGALLSLAPPPPLRRRSTTCSPPCRATSTPPSSRSSAPLRRSTGCGTAARATGACWRA